MPRLWTLQQNNRSIPSSRSELPLFAFILIPNSLGRDTFHEPSHLLQRPDTHKVHDPVLLDHCKLLTRLQLHPFPNLTRNHSLILGRHRHSSHSNHSSVLRSPNRTKHSHPKPIQDP